jgi:hypothetical protein
MLEFVHGRLALSTLLFTIAMGVWAGWIFVRRRGVDSNYWGALVIGETLVVGQGIVGLLLISSGARPADMLHLLYGVLVACGWPGVYIYTHARSTRREAALYALMSFFMFGLALRAVNTGGGLTR